jgi:vanillate O-demethylase ferredoxin subunit
MSQEEIEQKRSPRLLLNVHSVNVEADDIISIELRNSTGLTLPPFKAGAHIEVDLPGELVRHYSLCNSPLEQDRYVIAVLREAGSRGGSIRMHDLKPGDTISSSAPKNNFPLGGREANFHLLLAGGIGVTPMLAMLEELDARKADYLLHYCTRNPARTAFKDRLQPLINMGKVIIHHDDGDPARGLDIERTLSNPAPGSHVYICGPESFMAAAKRAVGAWAPHTIHFEHFAASPLSAEDAAWDAIPFDVKIKNTGQLVNVPANMSIVQALRAHGIDVETSCEEGYCGTCITRYVAGEPVHRDTVLSESERLSYVMVCRARSRTPVLVLDL